VDASRSRAEFTGNEGVANALGRAGDAYLRVPATRSGRGASAAGGGGGGDFDAKTDCGVSRVTDEKEQLQSGESVEDGRRVWR